MTTSRLRPLAQAVLSGAARPDEMRELAELVIASLESGDWPSARPSGECEGTKPRLTPEDVQRALDEGRRDRVLAERRMPWPSVVAAVAESLPTDPEDERIVGGLIAKATGEAKPLLRRHVPEADLGRDVDPFELPDLEVPPTQAELESKKRVALSLESLRRGEETFTADEVVAFARGRRPGSIADLIERYGESDQVPGFVRAPSPPGGVSPGRHAAAMGAVAKSIEHMRNGGKVYTLEEAKAEMARRRTRAALEKMRGSDGPYTGWGEDDGEHG